MFYYHVLLLMLDTCTGLKIQARPGPARGPQIFSGPARFRPANFEARPGPARQKNRFKQK